MRRCPDIAKAKKHFGYSPKNSWKESLHKTLKWYEIFLQMVTKLMSHHLRNRM